MKIKGRSNYKQGSQKDECASPRYACVPLLIALEHYRNRLMIQRNQFNIWEPATGMTDKVHTGLVDGLMAFGYNVYHRPGVDFVSADVGEVDEYFMSLNGYPLHACVSNPPFNKKSKSDFILTCDDNYKKFNLPWALLMLGTTHIEKKKEMRGCSIHCPWGRINFDMPNKGFGTPENPTKATFSTSWYSKGLFTNPCITYSDFNMSNHFKAIERFNEMIKEEQYG